MNKKDQVMLALDNLKNLIRAQSEGVEVSEVYIFYKEMKKEFLESGEWEEDKENPIILRRIKK